MYESVRPVREKPLILRVLPFGINVAKVGYLIVLICVAIFLNDRGGYE